MNIMNRLSDVVAFRSHMIQGKKVADYDTTTGAIVENREAISKLIAAHNEHQEAIGGKFAGAKTWKTAYDLIMRNEELEDEVKAISERYRDLLSDFEKASKRADSAEGKCEFLRKMLKRATAHALPVELQRLRDDHVKEIGSYLDRVRRLEKELVDARSKISDLGDDLFHEQTDNARLRYQIRKLKNK